AVLETRAAAALDIHAELEGHVAFLLDELADLVRRRVREIQRGRLVQHGLLTHLRLSNAGQVTDRLDLGADGRFCYACSAFALVNELAIDLRTDRHLDELVLNVADHPGFGPELDTLGRADIAFDHAVQHDVRNHDGALDAPA